MPSKFARCGLWASPESTRVVLDLSGQHAAQPAGTEKSGSGRPRRGRAAWRSSFNRAAARCRARSNRCAWRGVRRATCELFSICHDRFARRAFITTPNDQYGYRLVIDFGSAAGAETPVKVQHARPEARDLIIAIDAGHGGEDPGAIGKNGTREKDVVLAIARALAQRVDAEPGMKAVLTRNGDYFVPLRDRMRRARAQQADLFVSIHADSIRDRSVDGSSVYILSQRGATDEASRWLAERENASDLIGGVSLEDKGDVLASVLLDLSQSASLSASQAAAEQVLHQLNLVGEIRKPLVQQAGFVVLKSPDVPSMLVETAYISNPQEEQRLRGRPIKRNSPPPFTRVCAIISMPTRRRVRASPNSRRRRAAAGAHPGPGDTGGSGAAGPAITIAPR